MTEPRTPTEPAVASEPKLTLVVNGVEYRTNDRHIRGKLGGCLVEAMWDGKTTMRIEVGPHDPSDPKPIIYGEHAVPEAVEDQRLRRYGPGYVEDAGGRPTYHGQPLDGGETEAQ